ncbi:MAG: hypothetical protein JWL67_73 [Solirubrobacterales bacterium]|nr:hypothetical protein [Solirubrobacterales bacterium]
MALLLCLMSLGAVTPSAAAASGAAKPGRGVTAAVTAGAAGVGRPPRSALIVFLPAGEPQLASVNGLAVGIMSDTQGSYRTAQLLLDISQGARVASSAYPGPPPRLWLRQAGPGGLIEGWAVARRRAEDVPQLLQPGLLAANVPGGAAYVGVTGADSADGALAADRSGRVASLSIGSAASLLARVNAAQRRRLLGVADLPAGGEGLAELQALSRERSPGELLVVVQRALDQRGGELLWSAVAGLAGGGGRVLSSRTTKQRGLISATDLAPTILRALGPRAIPTAMRGQAITTDGVLHSASLRSLMSRLRVIGGRRLRALAWLLAAWALLLLAGTRSPRARARATRVGAIAVLWAPVAVLIPAALEPSAPVEYLIVVLACLGLGALTDAALPWPRAPVAPALAAVVLLVVDALAGSQLLMRSLLGPNPILGARFYGIGNELKSGLAVLVLAALAAALYPSTRGRRAASRIIAAGVVLAVVEGSARIGAGVGGVILVSAGFALAAVMMLPGALTRRRLLIVLITPVAGLLALALLDLAVAHGSGHFTGSILHARSAGDLRDVIVRRYTAAWGELKNHAMPAATAAALGAGWLGLTRRGRLLAPVAADPAWSAALAGGLAAGVVGALTEDSGPVLLVVAVFALVCVSSYLWGRTPHVSRSRISAIPAGAAKDDLVL